MTCKLSKLTEFNMAFGKIFRITDIVVKLIEIILTDVKITSHAAPQKLERTYRCFRWSSELSFHDHATKAWYGNVKSRNRAVSACCYSVSNSPFQILSTLKTNWQYSTWQNSARRKSLIPRTACGHRSCVSQQWCVGRLQLGLCLALASSFRFSWNTLRKIESAQVWIILLVQEVAWQFNCPILRMTSSAVKRRCYSELIRCGCHCTGGPV